MINNDISIESLILENKRLTSEIAELHSDIKNIKRIKDLEIEHIRKIAGDKIIKDLVDVIDVIDSAYKVSKDRHGLSLLYTKILRVIEKNGGTVFGAIGDAFECDLHEAVGTTNGHDVRPGLISEVYQHGVMIGDEVIRYAKVLVETDEN